MKTKTLLLVLLLTACAVAQNGDKNVDDSKITIDAVGSYHAPNGDLYRNARVHNPGDKLQFTIACSARRSDCVKLRPGARYFIELLVPDDLDGYGAFSVRVTGDHQSTVYFVSNFVSKGAQANAENHKR